MPAFCIFHPLLGQDIDSEQRTVRVEAGVTRGPAEEAAENGPARTTPW
ncbi:FAD/FMN-containing dehydrogenase [Micromonospora luteifusca]|uniref:FAD/FMN-containing dehydrogenase n=1 Tax=Micromonospora luteifusca TaxID=709860 RepID=A0ABS2LV83_9ACTN|nr:hypothetical protein [Micromonospora luteifusca]MBM7492090.1 FAD/FMN-containing dehydrogenase [Micromonospora luteifusca]